MGGVLDWSTTPGSNTTVDGVSIAEGMQAGLVNNGMRAIMALVREWQLDASGVVTAGAGNAYTITSNQGIAAYADGLRFSFRADRNNTGAATLNVDGRGAKALRKTAAGALTALASDDIVAEAAYDVVYDVSSDVFVIVGTHGVAGMTAFGQSLISAADAAAGRVVLNAQQLDPDLTALAGLASNGMIARTGAGTAAARTITAGAGVTVTNGDGVAGNPTITADPTIVGILTTTGAATVGPWALPAGVKRFTITSNKSSLSGTGHIIVQLRVAASFVTSGYDSRSLRGSSGNISSTAGMTVSLGGTSNYWDGAMDFWLHDPATNLWLCRHTGSIENTGQDMVTGSGSIALAGAVDGVQINSTAGTFDVSSFNVTY